MKMTLRSQSQGAPHPLVAAAVTEQVPERAPAGKIHEVSHPLPAASSTQTVPGWVPTIVAFHHNHQGYIQAKLHWKHKEEQAGEVIPLYCLRSTFPKNFPRNIPERPHWTAPSTVVDKLDRLHGPHSIDLFATQANSGSRPTALLNRNRGRHGAIQCTTIGAGTTLGRTHPHHFFQRSRTGWQVAPPWPSP